MKSKVEKKELIKKKVFINYMVKDYLIYLFPLIALIILLPLHILIGIIIKFDSKGPIFISKEELVKDLNDFYVYKFRTMVSNADKIGPTSTIIGDSRITNIGKNLRKYSLDELPQFINVFIGQMSFVGYRPGVRENYNKEDLDSAIFTVKPGITGYAQVMGRSALTKEDKRSLEMKYVNDLSFKVDIKIILMTIKKVIIAESSY